MAMLLPRKERRRDFMQRVVMVFALSLALMLLAVFPARAAWQLQSVTVAGTTYTITLRNPTVYVAPAEGRPLPSDTLLAGEYVMTFVYDGDVALVVFEDRIKQSIRQQVSKFNNQTMAKEPIVKDVTTKFQ